MCKNKANLEVIHPKKSTRCQGHVNAVPGWGGRCPVLHDEFRGFEDFVTGHQQSQGRPRAALAESGGCCSDVLVLMEILKQ